MTNIPASDAEHLPSFVITPRNFLIFLIYGFLAVFLGHLFALFLKFGMGWDTAMGVTLFFHFDQENNLPTLYSFILIASTAIMSFLFGVSRNDTAWQRAGWILLGSIMTFLALDELLLQFHEGLGDLVEFEGVMGGFQQFDWMIIFLPVMAFFLILLLPWFLKLDRQSQILFMIGGAVFVIGSVGFEVFGARAIIMSEQGTMKMNFWYDMAVTAEESLEIIGMSIFSYALFKRWCGTDGAVSVGIIHRRQSE